MNKQTAMKRSVPSPPVLEIAQKQPGSTSEEYELKRTVAKIVQGTPSPRRVSLTREEEEQQTR